MQRNWRVRIAGQMVQKKNQGNNRYNFGVRKPSSPGVVTHDFVKLPLPTFKESEQKVQVVLLQLFSHVNTHIHTHMGQCGGKVSYVVLNYVFDLNHCIIYSNCFRLINVCSPL